MMRVVSSVCRGPDAAVPAGRLTPKRAGHENLSSLHNHGQEIGLHSYTHPTVMAGLPPEDQRDEYVRNGDHLGAITGTRPCSMSHPCYSYDTTTWDILRSLDVTTGFRARPDWVSNDPLELPRQDHGTLMKQLAS